MKFKVEGECTPAEAREFLGLPNVAPLNDHLVQEMTRRLDDNIAVLKPDELMKNWMILGGQAQEHFMKLMTNVAAASLRGAKPDR